jgi:hypothetical protein
MANQASANRGNGGIEAGRQIEQAHQARLARGESSADQKLGAAG